jgi:hypothetical protein
MDLPEPLMGLLLLRQKLTRLCGGKFKELCIKGELKIVFLGCGTTQMRFLDNTRLETNTR